MATPPFKNEQVNLRRTFPAGIQASSVNMSAATGANAAATVSLTGSTPPDGGGTNLSPVKAGGVWWSYSGTPTGGRLTVQDGSNTILDIDITAGGPGFIPINPPWEGGAGNNLLTTLYAGGAGVTGKVGVNAWQAM